MILTKAYLTVIHNSKYNCIRKDVVIVTAVMQEAINLLQGFSEKEQNFALRVLQQIPNRKLNEDSYVCEFGYVHGDYNDETKAAFEETEEIIRQMKAGEYAGPTYNNFAEILAEIDEEIEAENNEKIII